MPSDKPRIATLTDHETIRKFKVVAATHNMSMSKYLEFIIKREIAEYEEKSTQK